MKCIFSYWPYVYVKNWANIYFIFQNGIDVFDKMNILFLSAENFRKCINVMIIFSVLFAVSIFPQSAEIKIFQSVSNS